MSEISVKKVVTPDMTTITSSMRELIASLSTRQQVVAAIDVSILFPDINLKSVLEEAIKTKIGTAVTETQQKSSRKAVNLRKDQFQALEALIVMLTTQTQLAAAYRICAEYCEVDLIKLISAKLLWKTP